MAQLKNDRLLRTIRRQPVDATPIWIMRQAGRYLPEYRKVRAEAGSFIKLCKTPELACAVTLQPIDRYALDAAIIFSDILTIPDAMGLGLEIIENEGPRFAKNIRSLHDVKSLRVPDPQNLQYVYDAISLVTRELNSRIPLIGFCGSPWTLAAYMVEGKSKTNFPHIHKMRQEAPEILHQLLKLLAAAVTAHLSGQIKAGVQIVKLFDTWGGLLDDESYREFSLSYLAEIIHNLKSLHTDVPIILFTKGGNRWLENMIQTQCDVIAVDWEITLHDARKRIGEKVALQGNLRPEYLLKDAKNIEHEVEKILASFGYGSGHIFNLGHGITPDIPPEHVNVLVNAVHEFSKPYHK